MEAKKFPGRGKSLNVLARAPPERINGGITGAIKKPSAASGATQQAMPYKSVEKQDTTKVMIAKSGKTAKNVAMPGVGKSLGSLNAGVTKPTSIIKSGL